MKLKRILLTAVLFLGALAASANELVDVIVSEMNQEMAPLCTEELTITCSADGDNIVLNLIFNFSQDQMELIDWDDQMVAFADSFIMSMGETDADRLSKAKILKDNNILYVIRISNADNTFSDTFSFSPIDYLTGD